MIWLTLRQFRTQAATGFAALAALAALLAVTGPGLAGDTVGNVKVSLTTGACAPAQGAPTRNECVAEINGLGYRQVMAYQPPGRFWPLQWCEAGIYALLTAGLTASAFTGSAGCPDHG